MQNLVYSELVDKKMATTGNVEDKLVKKEVSTYLDDKELKLIETLAEKVNLSRNKIIQQICRKYFGLPSVLLEADHYLHKEAEE